MRRIAILSFGILVAASLAAPTPLADHVTTTGSLNYVLANGVDIVHGIPGVREDIGLLTCPAGATLGGCMGGGNVHSHPANAVCPEECHTYHKATTTFTDLAFGPNVWGKLCLFNPNPPVGNAAALCDDGTVDGQPDAWQKGCGVTLTADATGIHSGDHHVAVFVRSLGVDPSTSTVCLGTTGTINVVFVGSA